MSVLEKKINTHPKYLCLSGCGLYFLSYLGILSEIDVQNVEIYCGSSGGALICTLLNIGYSINEFYNICLNIDFNDFQNISINNFSTQFGIDNFDKYKKLLLLFFTQKVKHDITFLELFNQTHKHLIITGSCINTGNAEYFDYITHPDMLIVVALQISISIPLLFNPVLYNNKLYIDGAYFDYLPIKFLTNLINKLNANKSDIVCITTSFDDYNQCNIDVFSYFYLIVIGIQKNAIAIDDYKSYNIIQIPIDINNMISSINLSISREQKESLYTIGSDYIKYILN